MFQEYEFGVNTKLFRRSGEREDPPMADVIAPPCPSHDMGGTGTLRPLRCHPTSRFTSGNDGDVAFVPLGGTTAFARGPRSVIVTALPPHPGLAFALVAYAMGIITL
jgi:hypothetical protein